MAYKNENTEQCCQQNLLPSACVTHTPQRTLTIRSPPPPPPYIDWIFPLCVLYGIIPRHIARYFLIDPFWFDRGKLPYITPLFTDNRRTLSNQVTEHIPHSISLVLYNKSFGKNE